MMDEETSKEPETEENRERKFNQEQYDMLKRCSDKKDMTEWNEWREKKENRYKDIELEGGDYSEWCLRNVNLAGPSLHNCDGKPNSGEVYLKHAIFQHADLDCAELQHAHLEHAELQWASLSDATLMDTHLEHAKLCFTHLEGADISGAYLQNTDLRSAHLDGCYSGYLPGQKLNINRHTDIRGVDLSLVWISPSTKQLLEYNIRRMNWEDWYKEHPRLKWLVKLFWWMSDYGLSTGRIILTFFGLAFIFANIYYHWGWINPPGIVRNLFIDRTSVVIPWQLVPLRTLYFSIVTMTTLGFGDMYAYPTSWFGHILLMVQVILGYVLLGALITRFAVLFTAGGPAGRFVYEREKDSGTSDK